MRDRFTPDIPGGVVVASDYQPTFRTDEHPFMQFHWLSMSTAGADLTGRFPSPNLDDLLACGGYLTHP
jgi:hypothetical protein